MGLEQSVLFCHAFVMVFCSLMRNKAELKCKRVFRVTVVGMSSSNFVNLAANFRLMESFRHLGLRRLGKS